MELKTQTLLLKESRPIALKAMGMFLRDSVLPEPLHASAKALRVGQEILLIFTFTVFFKSLETSDFIC